MPPPQPIPQEDPEVARLRELEQQRAEADRIKATQDQLRVETQLTNNQGIASLRGLSRRRGLTSLLGAG
jgi:hypothetical protein